MARELSEVAKTWHEVSKNQTLGNPAPSEVHAIRRRRCVEIARLHVSGVTAKEIADALKLTRQRVSQIIATGNRAISRGA